MADTTHEIGADAVDTAVAAPPAAEPRGETGPDGGILQVEAPKRYECSRWTMGKITRWPLRFLMALANVRLGMWVPNPRRLTTFHPRAPLLGKVHKHYPKPRPSYLFRELFGVNSVNSRFLYVTDGGHYENLGLVELLRRGCTEIYVFDASNDNFGALGDAVSLARSELEVEIDIDYSPLQVDAAKNRAQTDCVIGKITFPDEQRSKGTLYYSRLVMPPKAPADVVAYQARDPRFPHDPTTDQLYTDQRFEAYRCLAPSRPSRRSRNGRRRRGRGFRRRHMAGSSVPFGASVRRSPFRWKRSRRRLGVR